MGCGCNKKRTVTPPPSSSRAASAPVATMLDVIGPDGSLIASYSNLVTARAEARRSGGTVVPRTKSTASIPGASETTTEKEQADA